MCGTRHMGSTVTLAGSGHPEIHHRAGNATSLHICSLLKSTVLSNVFSFFSSEQISADNTQTNNKVGGRDSILDVVVAANPPNPLTHVTLSSPHRRIECLAALRSRAAMGALAPRLPGHGLSDLARKIAPHQALAIDAVWILGTSMMLKLLCVSILI